ncbi:Uma2 family endonuclease [Aetokthonos hydrillicola Thurmond2011]|jgi:Uma2 family endonuclease|uniref:Uma2 family endonuclease n=1 Tax=Aetokthonos hydrillicola Thurmond2011 TaxID=2712845 RepID=A0AAP5M667_9CYAN|nr:Uma2 family endonuclease [Aetokthonos hydrillicola]MBO3457528.1 Uma2 family endonuclease [Aetokthonos hydrillicola CCALA 1050]MBW4585947.1 Uma2 family endonuclease [Aetokthonos hydrillicola CCALA 1050]MDR9893825.1 Uma2 family endonuclease [Aetokthonos hydrillicola Thurmond2011]
MLETAIAESSDVILPPTQAELPYDDGVPMESERHKAQMDLLIDGLSPWLAERADGFVGGNMFVYFSLAQVKNQDFRGPDFFAVLEVPKGERRSWVVWEEGKAPDVVIELLSNSTAQQDKNEKKLIYQNQLRVSEYFWFDPFKPDDWAGFFLKQGIYQPLNFNEQNQLVSQSLNLALQLWQGTYKGIDATWLRWARIKGELLLTYEEQERSRAEQERLRAEQERSRAEKAELQLEQVQLQLQQTARNLLQAGMEVMEVARITGLSVSQVEQLLSENL